MPQISVRVSEDLNEQIETFSNETDGPKSEAVRTLLKRGIEYEDQQNETSRLRDQLAAANQRIDASNELVEYVEEERELQHDQRQRADAPVWRRAKWWVFGRNHEREHATD